ncbi:MAG TPA: AarF/UbiB family protein [bacterium]|nr:AarF/UbiB family protein [bacterium]
MKQTTPRPFKLSKTRFIRAYYTTFNILLRYLALMFFARLLDAERSLALFERAHVRTAKQIIRTLLNLKGLYIKLGQTLSAMGNILPQSLTQELELLQDQVPPHAFAEINERFLTDFGKTAEELFRKIDPQPIASASLGQVHVAYHKNGEKLAVKLQYPNIDKLVQADLKTIKNIFAIIHFIFPGYNLKTVVSEASQVILKELDYINEAQNIETIANNFKNADHILFPKVYHDLSSQKVLTLSFIEGTKITNLQEGVKISWDRKKIATDLINFYCKQVFVDGIYHADPHPGNIVITNEGKIAVFDFGAVATVSSQMKQGLTLFVEGLIKKDARMMSQAIKLMGFVAKRNDEETLEKVVDYFYSKIRGIKIDSFKNLDVTKFQNLNDLIELKKMDISLSDLTSLFVVPRDWIMLERTILLMSGLTAQLDDKLNPVEIVVPYVETFILGDDHKRLAEILLSTSKDIIISYINLPDDLHRLAKQIRTQGIRVENKSLQKELSGIRRSLKLVAIGIVTATCGILSYLFGSDGVTDIAHRLEFGFYALGVLFVLMLLRR